MGQTVSMETVDGNLVVPCLKFRELWMKTQLWFETQHRNIFQLSRASWGQKKAPHPPSETCFRFSVCPQVRCYFLKRVGVDVIVCVETWMFEGFSAEIKSFYKPLLNPWMLWRWWGLMNSDEVWWSLVRSGFQHHLLDAEENPLTTSGLHRVSKREEES